jgi:hypothetical protein
MTREHHIRASAVLNTAAMVRRKVEDIPRCTNCHKVYWPWYKKDDNGILLMCAHCYNEGDVLPPPDTKEPG